MSKKLDTCWPYEPGRDRTLLAGDSMRLLPAEHQNTSILLHCGGPTASKYRFRGSHNYLRRGCAFVSDPPHMWSLASVSASHCGGAVAEKNRSACPSGSWMHSRRCFIRGSPRRCSCREGASRGTGWTTPARRVRALLQLDLSAMGAQCWLAPRPN